MRKILSLILSIVLLVGMTIPVSASEISAPTIESTSVYLDADSKIEFAKQMDARYSADLKDGKIKKGTIEEIEKLMMQSTFASGNERESINKELAAYGVYEFNTSKIPTTITPYSGTNDVILQTPIIFYETWEKTWTVTCGGNWKNNNWAEQIWAGNVGEPDAFGVGYTNTSNPYSSYVIRSSAYITDQDNNRTVSTSYRSDGDGSKGFGFRLQDYIHANPNDSSYVGYKWYGSCTYDSKFGTYNGVATAYYIHTWSSAHITSLTFGVEGKTAGLSVSIDNMQKSFIGYSNDKIFGVYP